MPTYGPQRPLKLAISTPTKTQNVTAARAPEAERRAATPRPQLRRRDALCFRNTRAGVRLRSTKPVTAALGRRGRLPHEPQTCHADAMNTAKNKRLLLCTLAQKAC